MNAGSLRYLNYRYAGAIYWPSKQLVISCIHFCLVLPLAAHPATLPFGLIDRSDLVETELVILFNGLFCKLYFSNHQRSERVGNATVNGPREVGSVILLTPHLKNGRLGNAVVVLKYISVLHSVLSTPLIHVVTVLSKSVGVCCKRCSLYL